MAYLYAGTAAGLARYDGKQFSSLEGTADRPVPAGNIMCILRDSAGVLWFASDSGLYRYDGVTWSSLDEEDGLPSSIVNTRHPGPEGRLLDRHRERANPLPALAAETGPTGADRQDRHGTPEHRRHPGDQFRAVGGISL